MELQKRERTLPAGKDFFLRSDLGGWEDQDRPGVEKGIPGAESNVQMPQGWIGSTVYRDDGELGLIQQKGCVGRNRN